MKVSTAKKYAWYKHQHNTAHAENFHAFFWPENIIMNQIKNLKKRANQQIQFRSSGDSSDVLLHKYDASNDLTDHNWVWLKFFFFFSSIWTARLWVIEGCKLSY